MPYRCIEMSSEAVGTARYIPDEVGKLIVMRTLNVADNILSVNFVKEGLIIRMRLS